MSKNSNLSAEAESFVPAVYQGDSRGNEGPKLPHYVTTCYPFVNGDPGTQAHRGAVPWPTAARPGLAGAGPRMPIPQPGGFPMPGVMRPPGFAALPPFFATPGQPVPYGCVPPPSFIPFGQPPPVPPQWIPPPPNRPLLAIAPEAVSQYNAQSVFPPPQYSQPESQRSKDSKSSSTKKKSKKKKSDLSGMISIGTQNEISAHSVSGKDKKKVKTKTIICMDAALQTDFGDDIKNLTLAEEPSSLYEKDKSDGCWMQRYQQESSSELEEVDSDSGYSSPLHRRNQASNGTHPLLGMPQPPMMPAFLATRFPPAPYVYPPMPIDPRPAFIPTVQFPMPPHSGIRLNTVPTYTDTMQYKPVAAAVTHDVKPDDDSNKKKRRRRRKKKDNEEEEEVAALSDDPFTLHRTQSSSNVSRTSTLDNDILHFEDEDEFPNLLNAANGLVNNMPNSSTTNLSYSDILKSQVSTLSQDSNLSYSSSDRPRDTTASSEQKKLSPGKESKNARKRRKRREMANKAAEDELAEITIEQQVLKEMRSKAAINNPPANCKKSKQPLTLNIADMISALENPQPAPKVEHVLKSSQNASGVANALDSSAPLKRGKEREVPKAKKPSPLKKVILKEREERKRLRLLEEGVMDEDDPALSTMPGLPLDNSDTSQDAVSSISAISSKTSSLLELSIGTPASADMSPISQTSPISMSPLSGSPLSSGVHSPIATAMPFGHRSSMVSRIHSRRFREYCTQVLDKDIDNCCTQLLQDLVRFQDRLFHKDPIKSKNKRRIVLGLREVTKHLKMRKIRCVVISPNLERIQSKGGLDEALNNIIDMCHDQNVPFVFALGRRALGRACAKLVPVSVVGIFNFEGSEENFKRLIELTFKAQAAYMEMVSVLEKDTVSPAPVSITTSTANTPAISFPVYMGHSRTPSACSAISFTSSILSEPISENYPHSEPETDSRGYEIVKEEQQQAASCEQEQAEETQSEKTNSSNLSNKMAIVLDYEADTEECCEPSTPRAAEVSLNGFHDDDDDDDDEDDDDEDDEEEEEEEEEELDRDTVQELPHIDSIHSSVVDLSTEILSQHSSKTVEHSAEVMSTHSSKTLEGTAGGRATPDRSRNMGSTPDLRDSSSGGAGGGGQKNRAMDKERIETWVAETQKQIERLNVCSAGTSDVEEVSEEDIEEDENEQDCDAGIDFSAPVISEVGKQAGQLNR